MTPALLSAAARCALVAATAGLCLLTTPARAECQPPHQEPTAQQMQAAAAGAKDHGFLWEVAKDGHSSYLYGTIHVARLAWVFPGPELTRAVRARATIALELNLLEEETRSAIVQAQTRLDETPPPAAFTRWVRTQAAELCLPMERLEKVRPEIQMAVITMAVARQHGLEPEYGIDAVLTQTGQAMGKSLQALETAEDQLSALRASSADIEDALARGEFSADTAQRDLEVLLTLAGAWADSDLETLQAYPQWCRCMESTVDRQDMQRMVDDRNPKMAARVAELHAARHHVLAAVGSLHFIGEKDLPALLAQKGFTVRRVF